MQCLIRIHSNQIRECHEQVWDNHKADVCDVTASLSILIFRIGIRFKIQTQIFDFTKDPLPKNIPQSFFDGYQGLLLLKVRDSSRFFSHMDHIYLFQKMDSNLTRAVQYNIMLIKDTSYQKTESFGVERLLKSQFQKATLQIKNNF